MDIVLIILFVLALLAGLYLLLLMTGKPQRAQRMRSFLYAHRGFYSMSLNIPENSIPAFRRAKAFGYGVELDIQQTKDGKLVVFHDESLKRMCGIERNLRDCTYSQLLKYNLLGTGERIPLFEDVLQILGKETPIICEIKVYGDHTNLDICRSALPLLRQHQDHVVCESFNPLVLFFLRRNAPEIIRGQLSCDFSKNKEKLNPLIGFAVQHLLFNLITLPDFIAYRHSDARCISFRIAKKLYSPYTVGWTVHSDKEHRSALKNGFQSVIFESHQAVPQNRQPQRKSGI